MTTTLQDHWPDEISADVLTPEEILQFQAVQIAERTKGRLTGDLVTTTSTDNVVLQLDLIAPVLNGYRHRVLTARHPRDMDYPVTVWADCFEPPNGSLVPADRLYVPLDEKTTADIHKPSSRTATTDREFDQIVEAVQRSSEVKAIASSLVARSKRQRPPAPVPEGQ